jgi:predicted unusual protein kinase regulating ubiquinone biosynthesis (AarF/ABC1/UbiB family)
MIAVGIDPREVARRLYAVFMQQFFVTHFVHADPHPGNIFVRPTPVPESTGTEMAPGPTATPFVLAFVDFGMMTEIPERLRAALREFAIGLGTRDARRMVASYVQAGTLLEEADLERLVAAHEDLLERFWGIRIGRMREVAFGEARDLVRSYHDLLLSAPIQVQADMLFALRAVGLLAGLCTSLDPEFDPWAATVPFAERFAGEAVRTRLRERLEELVTQLGRILRVPEQLDALLARADRGAFGVRASFATDAGGRLDRLHRAVARLTWTIAAAGLAATGALLKTTQASVSVSTALFAAAALSAVAALLPRRGIR